MSALVVRLGFERRNKRARRVRTLCWAVHRAKAFACILAALKAPKTKQRFVMDVLETVLAQSSR